MARATTLTDKAAAMKHKYRVESGGSYVPGVTTAMSILDKPALKWSSSEIAAKSVVENARRKKTIIKNHREWLKNSAKGSSAGARKKYVLGCDGTDDEVFIHWARGEFDRQWRAKADRGTRVHDIAERWSKGEAVDVLESDAGFVDALEAFHLECVPSFELVECVVLNPVHKYGGRFDAIANLREFDEDGNVIFGRYLIDYKTGGHYAYEVATQTAAYAMGRLGVYDDKGNLVGFENLPKLDGARIIYLHEDGTFKTVNPFEKVSMAGAFKAFLAALDLYRINKSITEQLEIEGDNN